MAITTLDGIIAGMKVPEDFYKAGVTAEAAGVNHSSFYLAGRPGAATAPSPGLAGAALTSYAGQIPFPAAVGGQNVYLAKFEGAQAANVGGLILCDRLWHNSGLVVTTTTAQTVNSVAWPSRDQDGATSGNGVMVGIEVSTATTNGAAVTNMTMSYTNEAGTSARTATMASFPATAVAGTIVPFVLQAGDKGVRSIQSITLGTSLVTGTVHAVAYRQIACLPTPLANVSNSLDAIGLGFPRMYDNSVPFIMYNVVGTAVGIVDAQIIYAQG